MRFTVQQRAGRATVAVLALWTVTATAQTPPAASVDTNRVAVSAFANKTGQGKLKSVGTDAAAAISAMVTKEHVAEVAADPKDKTVAVRVDGSYTETNGKLAFSVKFTDGATGKKVLGAFGPVASAQGDYTALAEQVAVMLDGRRLWGDPNLAWPPIANWAAWVEVRAAAELFSKSDWAGALKRYQAAEKLDNSSVSIKHGIWVSYSNLGQTALSDSMEALIKPMMAGMPDVIKDGVDWLSLGHQRKWDDQYLVAQRIYARNAKDGYDLAYPAIRSGRFSEALELYRTRDTTLASNRAWRPWDYIPLFALHATGRLDEAIALSRDIEKKRVFDYATANAILYQLAAAGRFKEVEEVLARVNTLPILVASTYGGSLNIVGWEYWAHGHEQQAQDIFRRREAWYKALTPDQQKTYAVAMASAFAQAGDYAEAKARVEAITMSAPDNLANWGTAAYLAVQSNDAQLAAKTEARFIAESRPRFVADALYWRAATAALKGDCATAEKLLRDGLAVGITKFDYGFHWYYTTGKGKACAALPALYGPRQ